MKVSETNRNLIGSSSLCRPSATSASAELQLLERLKERFRPMQRLLNSSRLAKKVLRILCAVSMLLISMPVSNGTSRKFELTSDFIEPNETPRLRTLRLRRCG